MNNWAVLLCLQDGFCCFFIHGEIKNAKFENEFSKQVTTKKNYDILTTWSDANDKTVYNLPYGNVH